MSLRTSDFIHASAIRTPDAEALVFQDRRLSYAELAREVETWSGALLALGIAAGERVAIYLEKRIEAVTAMYDGDRAVVAPLWQALAVELGLSGLLVPEELGGAGATAREAARTVT